MSSESKIPLFEFHGLLLSKAGKQHVGDCPFCADDGHFFINEDGQWDCKKCGESGNAYSFLAKLHAHHLKLTTKENWETLADLRGLDWKHWKNAKVAYNEEMDRYLIPVKNLDGKLSNLAVAFQSDKGFQTFSTSGCAVHMFGGESIQDAPLVYLCEGFWKKESLLYLLQKNEVPESSFAAVGVPGAATFKDPWAEALKSKDVVFLYDNNVPGQDGTHKAIAKLEGKARSVRYLKWPVESDKFPDDYDVRKFVNDRIKKPKAAWKDLQALFAGGENVKPKKKLVRTTFESVLKDFKKRLHVTPTFRDALLVAFATVFSVRLPDDAVWMFLVGPPGSGKSLLIQTFSEAPQCESVSKLTSTSLVSGWRGGETDPSLLPKLKDRTLLVKDYTTIKSMPTSAQEELYGLLRDCYDRNVHVPYGTGESKTYKGLAFSMLAGVTHVIHGDNRATLGERFLKFEILDSDHDPNAQILAAITNVVELVETEADLQASVEAFLQKEVNLDKLPEVPTSVVNRVVALVQIAAYLRASVHRVQGDMVARPEAEIGTRLGKQLIKLGRCIAFVLDKKKIDEECYRIMEKVTFDTVIGWSLEIVEYLQSNPKNCTIRGIASHLQVSPSFIQKKLNDMQELRVVSNTALPSQGKGRPELVWSLTDRFAALWKAAQIKRNLPKNPRNKTRKVKRGVKRKRVKV